jgi:uncharacterized delta-60 repeat protein
MALQDDGKILIGGAFTSVNGTARSRLARLNADGSLDTSFNAGFGVENLIYDVAVQADGKIIVGGSFTVAVGNNVRLHVARLNADGSFDTSFASPMQPSTFGVPQSIVYSVALQADGKVILGGFIVANGSNFPPVVMPVARLNADGSFDASFNTGTIDSNLYDVAVQPDGKILIGGFFQTINGVPRKYLARLNADGSLDNSFDASAEATAPVFTIRLKPDGKILFSSLVILPSSGVAKQLNPNGTLDRAFNPPQTVLGQIYTILLTADDKILTGGSFSSPSGATLDSALVFNPDGSPDGSFKLDSTALGGVRAIAVQSDGKIIVGGNFNRVNGTGKNRLARLNPDGTRDDTFNTTGISAAQVSVLLIQPDGKILVGGTALGTNSASSILLRLNADGTLDNTFVPDIPAPRSSATALALQPDGKILISYTSPPTGFGSFNGLVRLDPNGSLDSTFTAPALQYEALAVLPDGKILAGGPTYIGYINSGTGESDFYYGVLRLNSDGAHDRSFRAGLITDGARFTRVYALALGADGKILVGGSLFTGSAPAPPFGVLRLNPGGALDGTFAQNAIAGGAESARVETLYQLPDGRLLVGGLFDSLGASPQKNIARLKADGQTDETFQAKTDAAVYDIELQGADKLLIGGDFEKVNNVSRTSLARLFNQPVMQRRAPFDFDGDGKTDVGIFRPADGSWWYTRSSANDFRVYAFGASGDLIAPGDYTGDGKADIAVWRPATGEWFIQRSEDDSFLSFPFGAAGDALAPADYDADGKTDPAVFRPSTGEWFILKSSGGTTITTFGQAGDIPVTADYDGDGRADIAIFRPADGSWWYVRSTDNQFRVFSFGVSTDKPVPGDYTGDGRADIAVFRPSTGEWFFQRSEDNSYFSVPFGQTGDVPAPGDYDGDGKFDTAVFRSATADWFVQRSTAGILITNFGSGGDRPIPNAFIP